MSGLAFKVPFGPESTGTLSELAIAQVIAPANHRILVGAYELGFDGQAVADGPVIVRLRRCSPDGTFTNTITPTKNDESLPETVQSVCKTGFNTNPVTMGDILSQVYIHPTGGREREPELLKPEYVKGGGAVCLTVEKDSGAARNIIGVLEVEE